MFEREISPANYLFLVEVAARLEVPSGRFLLSRDNLGVTLGIDQVLQFRKCSTHGTANQKLGLLLIKQLLSLASHLGDVEIPRAALVICRGEIQATPRVQPRRTCLRAAEVTRGAEQTSDPTTLSWLVGSLLYLRPS